MLFIDNKAITTVKPTKKDRYWKKQARNEQELERTDENKSLIEVILFLLICTHMYSFYEII
jgi:hypothetical protein